MTDKIKTLLITTPYFPPDGGGLERYAYEIASRLHRDFNWKIVVVTSGERYGNDVKEEMSGLTVYRLSYWLKISNTPFGFWWFKKIHKILREEDQDVINVHTPVPGIGDITAMFSGKTPLIVTYHAGSMRKGKMFSDILVWLYEHGLLHLLLRRANHIICSSDFVRFDFLGRYINKSTTITPAVDINIFKPDSTKKAKDPTILFVAGLGKAEQHKGLQTLIEAVKKIRESIPNVKLNVVGDGDMKGEYEKRVKNFDLGETVIFVGRLNREKLVEKYQQSNVFALPTNNDSFSMVILEAMSCALPVISTKVGSIPFLIIDSKTGFLINNDDIDALIKNLTNLLNDQLKAKNIGEAALEISKKFNWDEQLIKYTQVINNVLKSNPKIIHITPYYPPHLGGMEQRVNELVTNLAERDFNIAVFTSNIGTEARSELQKKVKVFYFRAWEIANTPIAFGLAWHIFKIKKPAIIHLHIANAFFPEITAVVSKICCIPYIAHIRGIVTPSSIFGKFLPFYQHFIIGRVLRGAKKVIVLTSDYKESIHNRFGVALDKITIIPNATNFKIVDQPRETIRYPINLLAVGRISSQKNYFFMIEVMEFLKKYYNLDFQLKIVGTGKEQCHLELEVHKRGIENKVKFVGEILGDKLQQLYTEADLLIQTSLYEGFSTVFLEAMAKALPIVASDVVGTRCVIENGRNGLLTDFSVENMAQAIMCFVNDPAFYKKISENNLKDVRKYNWQDIINSTIKIYNEIK